MTDVNGSGAAPPATVADLLVQRLRQLGVARVYGAELPGLDHVPVGDPDLAVLLADADGRIGHIDGSGRLGAATLAGPILHLSSKPGGTAPLQTIGSVEELVDALADPPGLSVPATTALHLDLDLNEPLTLTPVPSGSTDRSPVITLDRSLADLRMLVLAGPAVVRDAALDGLHRLSRAADAAVLVTWGAMGVERWDSPFHAGVGGLQERDLALGGLDDVDVVVVTGLDPSELPPDRLAHLVVQEVPTRQLAALCDHWPTRDATADRRPSVRDALAPVLTRLWEDGGSPLTGARAALHLSGALPERGVTVADPGPAGFWVARALPTSHPGSVCVPATVEPGFAAAAALVAALDGRPCLAVTDAAGVATDATAAVVDLARVLTLPFALQVWGDEGAMADAGSHVDLLRSHLDTTKVRIDPVPVHLDVPEDLRAMAGPVVAWPEK